MMNTKGVAALCFLAVLLSVAESQPQCIVEGSNVWSIDALTPDDVHNCVTYAYYNLPTGYSVNKFHIHSPTLTYLYSGVLYGLSINGLEIIAPKLKTISNDILGPDAVKVIQYLTISSNELTELNEHQWSDALNLWTFRLIGTKLTNISFAFMLNTNMRELYIHNATYLITIDRNEAGIMGTYVFENTAISELPQRMFEEHGMGAQNVTFKNNQNLKVLKQGVFQGGSVGLYINFVDTPIEQIEPDFIDFKKDGYTQIQLGGNKIGKIERAVFEPLFQIWNDNPTDNFIKWDVDGERTSAPVQCDCNVNWLLSNHNYLKWVKNAICTTGEPLEQLPPFGSDVCFECPSFSGLYPNPSDCTTFYQCSYYEAHIMTCPDGLVFNSAQNICDWPYNTAPPCGTAVGK